MQAVWLGRDLVFDNIRDVSYNVFEFSLFGGFYYLISHALDGALFPRGVAVGSALFCGGN